MRILHCTSILIFFLYIHPLYAQHAIDVQRKTLEGQHYDALLLYDKMSKRRVTIDAAIAAGKSAWALGLSERAIAEFDAVLRKPGIPDDKRARLLLSRGILEYQSERYQIAILYVEKVMNIVREPSPLRAKAWMLWGESLYELGSYGSAKEKYSTALKEASDSLLGDIHYLIGRCEVKLGQLEAARVHFESLPIMHSKTPDAIRSLASIALQLGTYDDVEFWLTRGRQQFPEYFIDSWVDYALAKVAMHKNNTDRVHEIYVQAVQKYPPSDHWLNLLSAAHESYYWQSRAHYFKDGSDE